MLDASKTEWILQSRGGLGHRPRAVLGALRGLTKTPQCACALERLCAELQALSAEGETEYVVQYTLYIYTHTTQRPIHNMPLNY